MKSEVQNLHKVFSQSCQELEAMLKDVDEKYSELDSLEELADYELALNELSNMLIHLNKQVAAKKKRIIYIMCVMYVQRGSLEPIRTPYITCTPYCTMMPKLPSASNINERVEYQKLLRSLGIGDDAITYSTVALNWDGLKAYFDQLTAEGKPLPEGVKLEQYPIFNVRHSRRHKAITD